MQQSNKHFQNGWGYGSAHNSSIKSSRSIQHTSVLLSRLRSMQLFFSVVLEGGSLRVERAEKIDVPTPPPALGNLESSAQTYLFGCFVEGGLKGINNLSFFTDIR